MTATTTKKPAGRKPGRPAGTTAKRKTIKKDDVKHAVAHEKADKPAHEPKKHTAKHITQNFYAVGKRKTAVAQAILSGGTGVITVNELPIETYFGTLDLQTIVRHPLVSIGLDKTVNIRSKIHGGGIHAQAESLRHAIARAITDMDPESRRTLKKLGFLTRDPRVKERKKPGLKRARRAPQFSKR
jgi:small subunit ribosomal protein S9